MANSKPQPHVKSTGRLEGTEYVVLYDESLPSASVPDEIVMINRRNSVNVGMLYGKKYDQEMIYVIVSTELFQVISPLKYQ